MRLRAESEAAFLALQVVLDVIYPRGQVTLAPPYGV